MSDAPPPLPTDPREALDRALAHILSALKSVNHANTRAAIHKMHSSVSSRELADLVQTLTNAQHQVMKAQRSFLEPTAPEKSTANGAGLPTRQP